MPAANAKAPSNKSFGQLPSTYVSLSVQMCNVSTVFSLIFTYVLVFTQGGAIVHRCNQTSLRAGFLVVSGLACR